MRILASRFTVSLLNEPNFCLRRTHIYSRKNGIQYSISPDGLPCTPRTLHEPRGVTVHHRALHRGVTVHPQGSPQMGYRAPPGLSTERLPCTPRALHRGVTVHPHGSPRRGYRAPPGLSTERLPCTHRVLHTEVSAHPKGPPQRGYRAPPGPSVSLEGLPCAPGPPWAQRVYRAPQDRPQIGYCAHPGP